MNVEYQKSFHSIFGKNVERHGIKVTLPLDKISLAESEHEYVVTVLGWCCALMGGGFS